MHTGKFTVGIFLVALVGALSPGVVFSQESNPSGKSAGPQPSGSGGAKEENHSDAKGKGIQNSAVAPPSNEWRNYGFGVAITYTLDLGSHDRVKNAQIVNNVVRVTEDSNAIPRIMLETHYFFKPNGRLFGVFDSVSNENDEKVWGHGPFVGIQPGSQNVIEAVAIGWMIGFHRPAANGESLLQSNSFNLGIGVVVDPKVQVLGDGITANQPLPSGETQVRFKDTAQYGLMIMSSFSF